MFTGCKQGRFALRRSAMSLTSCCGVELQLSCLRPVMCAGGTAPW